MAAGLDDALGWLEGMRFDADDLAYLHTLERFTDSFLEYLGNLRFDGEVHAIPEGRDRLRGEPLLRVTGQLPAAQLAGDLSAQPGPFSDDGGIEGGAGGAGGEGAAG